MPKGSYGFVDLGTMLAVALMLSLFMDMLSGGVAAVTAYATDHSRHHAAPGHSSIHVQRGGSSPEQSATAARASGTSSVIFIGDMLLARDVERRQRRLGWAYPFAGLAFSSIASSSYVFANFESAIPFTHQPTPDLQTRFSTPTSTLPALREAGVTHASLANNHSYDFGRPGYRHTIRALAAQQITPVGHPRQVATTSTTFLSLAGERVSVTSVNTVLVTLDEEALRQELRRAVAQSDLQVAYVHWGTEYQFAPDEQQRRVAALMASSGVDVIIGHHPHIVQNVEVIDDTLIIYSLGNYIFDQYFSVPVQQGLVVSLTMGADPHLQLHPVSSVGARNQPWALRGESRTQFLTTLAARSDPALATAIASGTIPLPLDLAHASKTAMMAP